MTRWNRFRAEVTAGWIAFRRRRTAMFFTFAFPILLVVIFGVLVSTGGGGQGLFTRDQGYYLPGYLAVVVLFTPLTRVGSTVARHRTGNRFEKLATTPLRRWEWLAAHSGVNVGVALLANAVVAALVVGLTGATIRLAGIPVVVVLVVAGTVVFCGIGAVLGRIADSRDGVVAAANAIAVPLVFLSETFVPPTLLPQWFRPIVSLSPVTYFARGIRAAAVTGEAWSGDVAVLVTVAVLAFVVGAWLVPRTD